MGVVSVTTGLGQTPIEKAEQTPDDLILWSVTTITGCLKAEGLMYWAAEQAALAAVHQQATWRGMLEDDNSDCSHLDADSCAAVKWLRDARQRPRKDRLSDAAMGTALHKALEDYSVSGKRPTPSELEDIISVVGGITVNVDNETAVLSSMVDSFDRWAQAAQPEYIAAEVVVYSPTYGYAGTADGFMRLDGVPLIFDYKSSRKSRDGRGKPKTPFPEVALQLAGYRFGEFAAVWRPRRTERFFRRYYLLSPEERAMAVPVPEVEGGVAIMVTPETCTAYPVRCDEAVFDSFLYVLEAARWHFDMSRDVVGGPLLLPQVEEVA